MSMRRSRITVKPNVGGPKGRQTAAKQSAAKEEIPVTVAAEDASNTTKNADNMKDTGTVNVTSASSDPQNVEHGTEIKSDKQKASGRRATAKPKPNIPGRGTVRSKTVDNSASEPDTSDTFTTIKTAQTEPIVKKETVKDKPSETKSKNSNNESVCDKPEVTHETKVHTDQRDKEGTADDSKKETRHIPARFRSRFAKARPNVEAVSRPRIRHPSLSQGDSDSFSVKEPPPVQRVVTLTNNESATSLPVFGKPADAVGGKDLIDIRKTPLKIPVREDYKQDGQSKKRKKLLVLEEPVDRGKLKMKDLIHMNPKSNPIKVPSEEEKERAESVSSLSLSPIRRNRKDSTVSTASSNRVKIGPDGQIILDDDNTETDKENENETQAKEADKTEEEDESVPAPQVTIGADGQIVLNEASLVLDNPIHESSQEDMEVVHETNSWSTTASQYGYKKKRVKLWTENETKKFYLALNAVGTDFSLMLKLFPGRSRAELKRKWQKEEKTSRHLLDKAITDRYQFEKDFFEELYELDKLDEELKESKQKKKSDKAASQEDRKSDSKRKRVQKKENEDVAVKGESAKKKRKKAKSKLYVESSSESDHEEPLLNDRDTASNNGDETIDETQVIANMRNKPSRSGRTIKTFILGQPGATSTVTTTLDGGASPLLSPKPSTEIRIRRISGTPSSPGPPVGRLRTLSTTSSQGRPRVRTLSGSSTASCNKAPGQFLALSNLQQAQSESPAGTNDMQPGSLVFVQSNPTVNEKGEVTPGLVHIYMVSSPPSANSPSTSKVGPASGVPHTPGGFKSNQFSLLRTPSNETVQTEAKVLHSPSILRKSPKRTPLSPRKGEDGSTGGKSLSLALSETHNVLAQPDVTIPENTAGSGSAEIQPVEILDVGATVDVSYGDSSNVLTVSEQQIDQTGNLGTDGVTVANEGDTIVSIELTETASDATQ